EMLKGSASRDADRREFSPGAAASVTVAPTTGRIATIDPTGKLVHVAVDRASGGVVIDRAEKSGVYIVSGDGREQAALAVNVSPDESDLRTLDPRDLQAQQDRRPAYLIGASERSLEDLHKNRPLWPYIILAAFLAMAIEQWLSGLGKKTKPQ